VFQFCSGEVFPINRHTGECRYPVSLNLIPSFFESFFASFNVCFNQYGLKSGREMNI